MDLQTTTRFFAWCTLINGALLLLWALFQATVPNLVYRTQSTWFPMPRETFHAVLYCFLGFFKVVFVVFNLVPYLALRIIGG